MGLGSVPVRLFRFVLSCEPSATEREGGVRAEGGEAEGEGTHAFLPSFRRKVESGSNGYVSICNQGLCAGRDVNKNTLCRKATLSVIISKKGGRGKTE